MRILGHKYRVFQTETLTSSSGNADLDKQEIQIKSNAPYNLKQEALIHEIFEALNYHLGLKLDHDHQLVPLSEGLHQVLTDLQIDVFAPFSDPVSKEQK